MTVQYLNVSGIKNYLPPSIKNIEPPKIPVLSQTTMAIFAKIQETLPKSKKLLHNFYPLDWFVTGLEEVAKKNEEEKKNQNFHQILSLVFLAVSVSAVAGILLFATFFLPPIVPGVAFALLLSGTFVSGLGFLSSLLYVTYSVTPVKEDRSLAKAAERSFQKIGSYIRAYKDKLYTAMSKDLHTLVLQEQIDQHKQALAELEAAKTFYSLNQGGPDESR